MSHFSAGEWFEFAGDHASSERKTLMQSHLDDGCDECRKLLEMWRRVLEISRREPAYNPPAAAVRSAKAAFVAQRKWSWLLQIAEVAQLIFDSIREPAPAAIRGATTSSRRSLQEAKPFMIDLRVECEPARKTVHLIGQVLNSEEPNKDVGEIEVFLLNGNYLAGRTTANTSGEFDLEFQDEQGLRLLIEIRRQKVVELRLPTSLGDENGRVGKGE